MKKVLLALAITAPLIGFSQWKSTSLGNAVVKESKQDIEVAGIYSLDTQVLQQKLENAPARFTNQPGKILTFPNANGQLERYEVWEASNFSPVLQAKFPEIRSYVGIGIDDPNAYLRFSTSPDGVSTMTLRPGTSEFIEPYTTDNSKYIVFDSKSHRNAGEIPFECSTPETTAMMDDSSQVFNRSSAGVFKTYRLAMSVTGEYTQYFGGTLAGAMGGINTTMTRVNGIFEKDFALQLILIDNNDEVVYLDPATDPYTNPANIAITQTQLHNTLTDVIGYDNFDIGHIFHRTGPGGNAGCIGCICDGPNPAIQSKGKATGYTSSGNGTPSGDRFDVDFVAHEIGHQLGANHTLTSHFEGTGVQVEPGSGSTIMGYAGTVPGLNVQNFSDDYFTYRNILQVQTNLQNKPCGTNITLANQAPVVDAGPDYEIPKGTAFKLTGTATDPDGDTLVYLWEQNDPGLPTTIGTESRVGFEKTIGPNFRSHHYVTEPVRYMPKFEYVLETDVSSTLGYWRSKWEAVTTVSRTFNFTFTARDNSTEGTQTNTDAMRVYVRNAGPFKISNITNDQDVELNSNSMLVEWDVAGTDSAPINTSHVRILLSTDNGESFTVVAESTPNDGSEVINFPTGTTQTTEARIMIEAIDNIYYAVSRKFNLTGTMSVTDMNNLAIGIYPNPNKGQFVVQAGNISNGNVKTSIYDTAGKLVYNQSNQHAGGKFEQSYNVRLATGVYVVVIETADGKTTEKLIIR